MQSVPQNNNEQISCIAQVKCFLSSIAKKKRKKKRGKSTRSVTTLMPV